MINERPLTEYAGLAVGMAQNIFGTGYSPCIGQKPIGLLGIFATDTEQGGVSMCVPGEGIAIAVSGLKHLPDSFGSAESPNNINNLQQLWSRMAASYLPSFSMASSHSIGLKTLDQLPLEVFLLADHSMLTSYCVDEVQAYINQRGNIIGRASLRTKSSQKGSTFDAMPKRHGDDLVTDGGVSNSDLARHD